MGCVPNGKDLAYPVAVDGYESQPPRPTGKGLRAFTESLLTARLGPFKTISIIS